MSDIVSPTARSRMMSGIRGKNSLPEILVRRLLFASGFRFRLHRRDLPGTPDIVMPGRKIAIFVHGCFWHAHRGCRYATTPSTRTDFWTTKLRANVDRDQRAIAELASRGWRVLCVWECATRDPKTRESLRSRIVAWIEADSPYEEIGGPPVSPS
ncbi:very short patch repair endonuclease [Quisquiliibacterium transsilvanicum]|uniref:very short patch repair endonuclease n=1 Tax=Quisquiliibacterium transsilvanicum TaxID=1549638 RepID=UPI00160F4BFA|nr:DNA mismatch endonuclease Vsr [Quisquiliibacterium transsilvanicum]